LIALTIYHQVQPALPAYMDYSLWEGCSPVQEDLTQLIKDFSKYYDFGHRRSASISKGIESQSVNLARHYMSQWPCEKPNPPFHPKDFHRLELNKIMNVIHAQFGSFYRNDALRRHVLGLQTILDAMNGKHEIPDFPTVQPALSSLRSRQRVAHPMSMLDLFESNAPDLTKLSSNSPKVLISSPLAIPVLQHSPSESHQLGSLLGELTKSKDPVDRGYGEILRESHIQYLEGDELATPSEFPWSPEEITHNRKAWEAHMNAVYDLIVKTLQSYLGIVGSLGILSGIAPNIQIRDFLSLLGGKDFASLSEDWQRVLIYFVSAVTQFQRAGRLLSLQVSHTSTSFSAIFTLLH